MRCHREVQALAFSGSGCIALSPPDYLVLGHVTRDLLPDGTRRYGGTALYAATTAQRLGLHAAVLTAASSLPATLIPSAACVCLPSATTTTFQNEYSGTARRQWLYAVAADLHLDALPRSWYAAPVVHLGPVLGECDSTLIEQFPHALIGVTPQGWMRRQGADLPALVERRVWQPDAALLRRIAALIVSIEDLGGDEAIAAAYARACPLVALTRGDQGVTLYVANQRYDLAAYPAREVDPTGAGDVFAAALLVRLYETGDALESARFALAVAAASVEAPGINGIPNRDEALQRMQQKNMSEVFANYS